MDTAQEAEPRKVDVSKEVEALVQAVANLHETVAPPGIILHNIALTIVRKFEAGEEQTIGDICKLLQQRLGCRNPEEWQYESEVRTSPQTADGIAASKKDRAKLLAQRQSEICKILHRAAHDIMKWVPAPHDPDTERQLYQSLKSALNKRPQSVKQQVATKRPLPSGAGSSGSTWKSPTTPGACGLCGSTSCSGNCFK